MTQKDLTQKDLTQKDLTQKDLTQKEEEEALEFLQTLNTPPSITSIGDSDIEDKEKKMIQENERIIKKSNELILDRLDNADESLTIKDIIQAKSEAFKNNQTIKGLDNDLVDPRKLIPTTINIQINNN